MSDKNCSDNYKSWHNFHPHHSNQVSDHFRKRGRDYHFMVCNEDGNCVRCMWIEEICKDLPRNNNTIKGNIMLQLGIVIDNNKCTQLPHRDYAECSYHVSGNYEGL